VKIHDPEADNEGDTDPGANSSYLPLPWKGRLPLEDPSQPKLQRRIVLTEIGRPISVVSKHMLKPLVCPQAAPFASEALAEAGKATAELGHRLTTHRGQFTQLG
jgi:hypothetical protein